MKINKKFAVICAALAVCLIIPAAAVIMNLSGKDHSYFAHGEYTWEDFVKIYNKKTAESNYISDEEKAKWTEVFDSGMAGFVVKLNGSLALYDVRDFSEYRLDAIRRLYTYPDIEKPGMNPIRKWGKLSINMPGSPPSKARGRNSLSL